MIKLEELLNALNYDGYTTEVIIHDGDNRFNSDIDKLEEKIFQKNITDIIVDTDDMGVVINIFIEKNKRSKK